MSLLVFQEKQALASVAKISALKLMKRMLFDIVKAQNYLNQQKIGKFEEKIVVVSRGT